MTTTHRQMRRPKAIKRKGAGWSAFWNLCTALTRAWQQGRTATRTRPRRAPGGTGSTPRTGRPRGLASPGSQPDRLLVDLARDNPWLDSGSAGDQLDDAQDDLDGVDAGEPDDLATGGCPTGGGVA